MRFEMKNLTSFPIEKLCFDLKLEMLEQMEPRGVLELAKVNQELQGMLVRDPSIVFGRRVSQIQVYKERMEIKKFSNSDEMELNCFSHFSFVKKIRSCDYLGLGSNSKEALEKFFSNLHASIKGAWLDIRFDVGDEDDQVIKDLIENFIVARLKDCEKIGIEYHSKDLLRFYYNALLRTQIKNVDVNDEYGGCIDLTAQQIVTNGIPSKNPEAAIFFHAHKPYSTMDLSRYPEMLRIEGENCRRLLKQANDLVGNFEWSRPNSDFFEEESSMFRRRIDSTRDCICVYNNESCTYFLAFYVPVD